MPLKLIFVNQFCFKLELSVFMEKISNFISLLAFGRPFLYKPLPFRFIHVNLFSNVENLKFHQKTSLWLHKWKNRNLVNQIGSLWLFLSIIQRFEGFSPPRYPRLVGHAWLKKLRHPVIKIAYIRMEPQQLIPTRNVHSKLLVQFTLSPPPPIHSNHSLFVAAYSTVLASSAFPRKTSFMLALNSK